MITPIRSSSSFILPPSILRALCASVVMLLTLRKDSKSVFENSKYDPIPIIATSS